MPYRLKASESVPEGVRRVVLEEIESATDLLGRSSKTKRDEAVHEARKSIKKIRGVLRLMRPELGKTYTEENNRFREVGRQLSQLRDAAAQIEMFDQLAEKFAGKIEQGSLADVRAGLVRHKREIEQRLDVAKVVERASATLHSARARVGKWGLSRDGFGALAPGLEQTVRRGRNALRAARKTQDPVAYHDFRKRVKDHWYHVRLLESVWTEIMQAHEASLKELETWLGDDHNLVVLSEMLNEKPEEYGGKNTVQLFLAVTGLHQKELRENSISLGERVYSEKPKRFVESIALLWKAWQAQPQSMKNVEQEQRRESAKKPAKSTGRKPKQAVA